jgi:hypothetical protein
LKVKVGITTTSSRLAVENNNLIVAYTTREHLCLDLDETDLFKVQRLAKMIIESYPEVGDILILSSSTPSKTDYTKFDSKGIPRHRWTYQNYHLVGDNTISYERALEIIDALVELDILQAEYREIRLFRGDMSLRTSRKPLLNRSVQAPKPELIVYNHVCGRHDGKILVFYDFLKATKTALEDAYLDPKFLRAMQKADPL